MNAVKPDIIQDFEDSFGDALWSDARDFKLNHEHIETIFDIVNRRIFDGKLDSAEEKRLIVDSEDGKFGGITAAFTGGLVKGEKHRIIVVRHPKLDNFFQIVNTLIHEMIHFYDFSFGPMGRNVERYFQCGVFNYGGPYGNDKGECAANSGLIASQLPDNLPTDGHPRQYQFPRFDIQKSAKSGFPRLVSKYRIGEDGGMYDVHGRFFRKYAEKANSFGFDVRDVAGWDSSRMRKVYEAEFGIPVKSSDNVFFDVRDSKNWRVEIW